MKIFSSLIKINVRGFLYLDMYTNLFYNLMRTISLKSQKDGMRISKKSSTFLENSYLNSIKFVILHSLKIFSEKILMLKNLEICRATTIKSVKFQEYFFTTLQSFKDI